ncbi:MAG: hypothetical protein ACREDK_03280 [Thermoplasmata archaeon]
MVWFGVTVVLILLLTRTILLDPVFLTLTLAMLAGFGALFLWRNRSRARDPWMGGFPDNGRVGDTPEALLVEGWWGRLPIPWRDLEVPTPVIIRGRVRFEFRYSSAGKQKRFRVGPHWMKAILDLPHVPAWDLPLTFRSTLASALGEATESSS